MSASKVLPCPFCGSRASLNAVREGKSTLRNRYWRGWIKCSNNKCGATSKVMSNPDAAIRWWNRRPETASDIEASDQEAVEA